MRTTLLAFMVSVVAVGASGCFQGKPETVCSQATCNGCCDQAGACQGGFTSGACGAFGAACSACSVGNICQGGQCLAANGGGGGAGGGSGVGGGGVGGGVGGGTGGGSAMLDCNLPATLDWGTVMRGSSTPLTLTLNNPTASDVSASIGNVFSTSGDHTAFAQSGALGTVNVVAGASQIAIFTFHPTFLQDYLAYVKVTLGSCPEQTIKVIGSSVDSILSWAPSPLDFGYCAPGVETCRDLTFANLGSMPVQVSGFTPSTTEFRVTTGASVTVPANGTAKANVCFKPALLGPRLARLDFITNLGPQPTGVATLRGVGGGPVINVQPSPTLDFGPVAYFVGANPPTSQSRTLVIKNAGQAPVPPDPAGNLRLGQIVNGVVGTTPYFVISGPNASEFSATLSVSYNSALGLLAGAPASTTDLVVAFTPSSVGSKSISLAIFSNDQVTPQKTITVTANAVLLAPCSYSVAPVNLNFGLVSQGTTRDLALTIRNNSTITGENCQLSNISIAGGSNAAFVIPGGAISQVTLLPGASTIVPVRVAPPGPSPTTVTNIVGSLRFDVSSLTGPVATVPLFATLGATCLALAPNHFDFGTVENNCNSATRTFILYNTCTSSVLINSSSMVLPAGEPAGGPNCPGAAACPEFLPVNAAGILAGTMIAPGGAGATFSLKYRPINLGADNGAFLIKATQNGQVVDYVLPLVGKGDAAGLNVDTIIPSAKADVLLVIDNSCSMSDKQTALAANFASFLSYPTSAGVDYQIGITTTDMDVEAGKLVTMISSTAPDGGSASAVELGTNGSGIEQSLAPATAALTPPLVNGLNAGLVRSDASLAVVAVSDADDQSPQSVSFYVSQLLSLKPPGQFTFSSIGPYLPSAPAPCFYDATAGAPRTISAANATGGVTEEICTTNWAAALSQLSPVAFGFHARFLLTAIPDLSGGKTIVVKVGGVVVAPISTGGTTVWTYDALGNSVNFAPLYVPQPGDVVTLNYSVACIP